MLCWANGVLNLKLGLRCVSASDLFLLEGREQTSVMDVTTTRFVTTEVAQVHSPNTRVTISIIRDLLLFPTVLIID